jgi:hypothetical protein
MKTIITSLCLIFLSGHLVSQSPTTSNVIEGGKVVVELIKVFGSRKDQEKEKDCKGHHANLCVLNEGQQAITVSLHHRLSDETRELFIQPALKECSLQIPLGVWTYDLRVSGNFSPIRKGDILLESCQDLSMHIRF